MHSAQIPISKFGILCTFPPGFPTKLSTASGRRKAPGGLETEYMTRISGLISPSSRLAMAAFGLTAAAWGQTPAVQINLQGPATRISPFIYGANEWCNPADVPYTAARWGGNRQTGYNWETN